MDDVTERSRPAGLELIGVAVGPGEPVPTRLRIEGDRITAVDPDPGRPAGQDEPLLVPGFVDLHCHGGAGASLASGDPDECARAVHHHRRHGTTRQFASLVSALEAETLRSCAGLAGLVRRGEIAGIHLEGPFLSPAFAGAHDERVLREPDPARLERAQDAAEGGLRMVTVAPELPGATELIHWCHDHGVIAAIGHTDATAEETSRAVEAGATVATHLCNAMRPLHHRDPGPVPVLLSDPSVTCELILDGAHLARPMVDLAATAAGPDRLMAVSDAIGARGDRAATRLGTLDVELRDGVPTVAGTPTLAGSLITLADSFRQVLDWGWSLADATRLHSTTPARVAGLEVGFRVGGLADLVELDPHTRRVRRVLRDGRWLTPAGPVTPSRG